MTSSLTVMGYSALRECALLILLLTKPETKLGNKMVMLDDDPMITKFSDLFQLKADNSNCSVCEKKMGNVNLLSGRGIEHKCPVKTTPSNSGANLKICSVQKLRNISPIPNKHHFRSV